MAAFLQLWPAWLAIVGISTATYIACTANNSSKDAPMATPHARTSALNRPGRSDGAAPGNASGATRLAQGWDRALGALARWHEAHPHRHASGHWSAKLARPAHGPDWQRQD
jgi:hypothetical protein